MKLKFKIVQVFVESIANDFEFALPVNRPVVNNPFGHDVTTNQASRSADFNGTTWAIGR